MREGVKSTMRKDQALLRDTQRTDGDDIEAQIAQRRHSLLSLAICKLSLDLSFTIHWVDDQGHVISLNLNISCL